MHADGLGDLGDGVLPLAVWVGRSVHGRAILEHDGGGNRAQTVAALKIWLPRLPGAGHEFTTP